MSEENKVLKDSIKYIMDIKLPSEIVEDEQAYLKFCFIDKCIDNETIDFNIVCSLGYVETISILIGYFSEIKDKLNLKKIMLIAIIYVKEYFFFDK